MSIKPRPVPEKIRSANSNCIGPRQIQAEPAPTRLAHGWHCRGPSGRVMRRSRRTDNVDRFRPRNHSRGRRSSRSVTRRARDETCAGSSSCRHRTDDALSAMVQPLPRAVSLSTIVMRSPGWATRSTYRSQISTQPSMVALSWRRPDHRLGHNAPQGRSPWAPM